MYIALLIILTLFSIVELLNKLKKNKIIFIILSTVLTLILAFRYGQGTDYFAYYTQYLKTNSYSSLFINELTHGEIGWHAIMVLLKRANISFELFIIMLSIIMMSSVCYSIYNYSPYRLTSLLILYPTYYLTYMFSALRQGLVMSIFIGFGIKYLLNKNYVKYFILISILSFIHNGALILIIIPILISFREILLEKYLIFFSIIGMVIAYSGIIDKYFRDFRFYIYINNSFSIMAVLIRLLLMYTIYKFHKSNDEKDVVEDLLYYIYVTGFSLFLILSFSGTLSQRLTMPMKSIETILLPLAFNNYEKSKTKPIVRLKLGNTKVYPLIIAIILSLNVETIKNINAYIEQDNYYHWVNPINYPYGNIFNKDKIRNYVLYFKNEIN